MELAGKIIGETNLRNETREATKKVIITRK